MDTDQTEVHHKTYDMKTMAGSWAVARCLVSQTMEITQKQGVQRPSRSVLKKHKKSSGFLLDAAVQRAVRQLGLWPGPRVTMMTGAESIRRPFQNRAQCLLTHAPNR
jgi:hypothetical protein